MNSSFTSNCSFLAGDRRGGSGLQRIGDDGMIAEHIYSITGKVSNPVDMKFSQVTIDGSGKVVGQYWWSPQSFRAEFIELPSHPADSPLLIRLDKVVASYDEVGNASETILTIYPKKTADGTWLYKWREMIADEILIPLNAQGAKIGFAFLCSGSLMKIDFKLPYTFTAKLFSPKVLINI